ncbi:MAG TPA: T9SS type A sorting domain-containing protein, partial [Chitinophagales bacterium]|nr:T9SS type A sorting domain-containing protein [Chitinophagales bacterium]
NKEHIVSGITSLHLNHVYPSPATTNLYLNLYNTTERSLWFNIYDIQGSLVRVVEQRLNEGINDVFFNVDDLSDGVYWIQSNLGERAVVFVKQ